MRLAQSHRLYILGAILLVTLVICARNFGGEGEAFPIVPLLVAGFAYLLAIREFFCCSSPNLRMRRLSFAATTLKGWKLAGQCCVAFLPAEGYSEF